jgi:hypothetical protein
MQIMHALASSATAAILVVLLEVQRKLGKEGRLCVLGGSINLLFVSTLNDYSILCVSIFSIFPAFWIKPIQKSSLAATPHRAPHRTPQRTPHRTPHFPAFLYKYVPEWCKNGKN